MKLLDRYYHAIGRIVPGSRVAGSRLLYRYLYELPYHRLRKPAIGLFELDNVLGWRNRPAVRSVHPAYEYRVTYSTDDAGCRIGKRAGLQPAMLFLGCSWTFGHGVDDHQTYPYLLESRYGQPCRSLAVMGYGPTQGLLQLTCAGWLDRVLPGMRVMYCWIPEQLMRAWRRRSWIALNAWVNPGGPSHPVFDFENGRLHERGLVGLSGAVDPPAGQPDLVERMEWRVTVEVLARMAQLVAARGAAFQTILPPLAGKHDDPRLANELRRLLRARKIALVDLEAAHAANPALAREELFYRFDGHPTPAWHSVVADLLAAI